MRRNGFTIVLLATSVWLGLIGTTALGSTLTMQNGNSTVTIDPYGQDGVNQWSVNGVNQLFQQWFWYGIGGGSDSSIDTLSAPSIAQFGPGNKFTDVVYTGTNNLSIEVDYSLNGGRPGTNHSDLGELIDLMNTSLTSSITVSFYEYSNFTLNNRFGESVSFPNSNTVDVNSPNSSLAETVETPSPFEWEGRVAPITLNKLNSGLPTTLSDFPPIGAPPFSEGNGDMTWAYEWDIVIPPGDDYQISKDKQLTVNLSSVPEPSTLGLLSIAAFGLISFAWRRHRA